MNNSTPTTPDEIEVTTTNEATPSISWLIAFIGLAIFGVIGGLVVNDKGSENQFYLRIIIGISVAGIGSVIPGFFEIKIGWLKNFIRAGGALGLFVLIFLINPPKIEDSFSPTINLSGRWDFYLETSDGELPGGVATIEHKEGENGFVIHGDVPSSSKNTVKVPRITFDSDFSVITNKKIIFHYKTNLDEEGVAVANYSGSSFDRLLFNFRDYSENNHDLFPSGILIFKKVPE